MNVTDFLLARIEEDEMRASSGWSRLGDERWDTTEYGQDFLTPTAVLAECTAKRAVIELWEDPNGIDTLTGEVDAGYVVGVDAAVHVLAAVYKDHPDYQKEWANG